MDYGEIPKPKQIKKKMSKNEKGKIIRKKKQSKGNFENPILTLLAKHI